MTPRLLALLVLLPVAARAELPPLGQVPEVTEGLIAVAIAYEIGERCDGIDARRVAGISYLLQLRGIARTLGYSAEAIDAFVDDDAEKDRLEAVARARLASMGAVPGDAPSHCAVGRAEIAAGSVVGSLLRG